MQTYSCIVRSQSVKHKILEIQLFQLTGAGMKASWYFLGLILNCPCSENMHNLTMNLMWNMAAARLNG